MAAKENSFDTQGNTLQEVAATAIVSGSFAFETLIAKFYSGTDTAAGQPVAPYVGNCTIKILKQTLTDTFAIGALVKGDATLQTALTTLGDGNLGYAAAASSATDTHVIVRMTN